MATRSDAHVTHDGADESSDQHIGRGTGLLRVFIWIWWAPITIVGLGMTIVNLVESDDSSVSSYDELGVRTRTAVVLVLNCMSILLSIIALCGWGRDAYLLRVLQSKFNVIAGIPEEIQLGKVSKALNRSGLIPDEHVIHNE